MSAEADPPARLDLEVARLNGDSMRERYEQVREEASGGADVVERFCQQVERDGRVSINAPSARLLGMLRNGYYPNPHDEARERARLEGGDSEQHLKRQQGDFYRKRVAFDRSFVNGESFRYASLNIGGAGLSYYGLYCLVLRDPDPGDGDLAALLPANSLKRFMNDELQLDAAALRREVAPWPNRHHLAARKHARDVASIPDAAWPQMMCHATETDESFVEVILGSPVTPQALTELRVDTARLDELVAGTVTGALTDSERTELMARLEVLEELAKHKLETLYREV
jgi:hypothetical protein